VNIAIVGAGYTGLSAAYNLAKVGIKWDGKYEDDEGE